jgi:DNA helicase-2/ATP-dependent DNA helicase PcrA
METFGSTYNTPGWQRAKGQGAGGGFSGSSGRGSGGYGNGTGGGTGGFRDGGQASYRSGSGGSWQGGAGTGSQTRSQAVPQIIEGELITKSTGVTSAYKTGDRVFHQKFGNGTVVQIEGNKLTIQFDRAGEKKVVDRFVQKA